MSSYEYMKKWFLTDKGKEYLKRQREYRKKRKKMLKEKGLWKTKRGNRKSQSYRFRRKYPYKNKAYQAIYFYTKNGTIRKPKRCQLCRKGGRIVGHHKDYERKLKVMWVCEECHTSIIHKQ